MVTVNPGVPANSIKDLIALAKAKPGTLNYASGGMGTANHVAGELFKYMANVDIAHVPYKGGGPAVSDLVAGHVQIYIGTIGSAREFVTADASPRHDGAQRTPIAPDPPHRRGVGPAGPRCSRAWRLRAGTEAGSSTSSALAAIPRAPEVRETLKANGNDPIGSSRRKPPRSSARSGQVVEGHQRIGTQTG